MLDVRHDTIMPTRMPITPEATIHPHPLVGRDRMALPMRNRRDTINESASNSVSAARPGIIYTAAGVLAFYNPMQRISTSLALILASSKDCSLLQV